jgi:hypothetical protein
MLPDHSGLDMAALHDQFVAPIRGTVVPEEKYKDNTEEIAVYGVNLGATALRVALNNHVWSRTSGAGPNREHFLKIAFPSESSPAGGSTINSVTFGASEHRSWPPNSGHEDPYIFLHTEKLAIIDEGLSVVGLTSEDVERVKQRPPASALVEECFHAGNVEDEGLKRAWGIGIEIMSRLPGGLLQPIENVEDLYPGLRPVPDRDINI